MVWGFTAALCLTIAMMRAPLYGHVVPVQCDSSVLAPLARSLKLLLGGLLLWVAWEGMRKDHAGAWLAMPAVGLVTVSLYQQELMRAASAAELLPVRHGSEISARLRSWYRSTSSPFC